MIAFDNGPANGDYVRYIDALTKRAAIAASAGILTDDVGSAEALARVRARLAAEAAAAMPRSGGDPWTPGGTPSSEASRATGFATPVVATPAATAAAAIASALMSGQISRIALTTPIRIGLGAIAVGIALIVAAFVLVPVNVLFIAGGAALIAWAVRMMRDATARASSTRV